MFNDMTNINIAVYIVRFMDLKGKIITIVLFLFDDDGPASAIVVGIDKACKFLNAVPNQIVSQIKIVVEY